MMIHNQGGGVRPSACAHACVEEFNLLAEIFAESVILQGAWCTEVVAHTEISDSRNRSLPDVTHLSKESYCLDPSELFNDLMSGDKQKRLTRFDHRTNRKSFK